MNRSEALSALAELAAHPAAGWIGNRIEGGATGDWSRLLQCCMRCRTQESLDLPPDIRGPDGFVDRSRVPEDFDDKLIAWKRAFQEAHQSCVDAPGNTSGALRRE